MPPIPLSLGLSSARGRYGPDNAVTVENAYSEVLQTGGKNSVAMYAAPGLLPWVNDTPGMTRGLLPTEWALYRAAGGSVSAITADGGRTTIGQLPGSGPAFMARNALADPMIPIVSDGRVFVMRSNTVTPFATDALPPPVKVDFIRGRFVFPISDGRFYYTRVNDMTVEGDAVYNAEGKPDGLVGSWVRRNELWLFGTLSLEIWTPTEDADDPFTQYGGGARAIGCMSAGSICEISDALFWVDNNGQVRRATGYEPVDIGTPFTNRIIMADPMRSSIEGHGYNIGNADYYEISGSNFTLRYSLLTGQWTERRTRNRKRWRGAGAADFGGRTVVPDLETGALYHLDENYGFDGDEPIIMRFVSEIVHAFPAPLGLYSLHLDAMAGQGMLTGLEVLDDPVAILRISDDGGQSWSAPLEEPLGRQGRKARAIWRQLGTVERQGGAIEISLPTPVARCVMSAVLNAEDGTA